MKIHDSILATIGNTPLVRAPSIAKDAGADIVLKLEFFNPLSSVKDRIGLAMVEDAEKNGTLRPGMRLIEPTSGNTGIALAFVAAAKNYPLILVMPETMSQERRALLLLLGAELILTPGPMGMRGAVAKAMQLVDADKNAFMPAQFDNPANPAIHEATTAREIWEATDGRVDIVISGVGTGGTLSGVGKVLKQKKPSVRMIAVEPEESPVISGGTPGPHKIQGIGAGFIPNTLNIKMIDGIEKVSSDAALAMARRLIKEEGIPAGISSGAALEAGLRQAGLAQNKGKMIVVILPSSAERYLSTALAQTERATAQALEVQQPDAAYMDKAAQRYGVL